jgi:hypothetical protein
MKKNIKIRKRAWRLDLWDNSRALFGWPEYWYVVGITIEHAVISMVEELAQNPKSKLARFNQKDICCETKFSMLKENVIVIWQDNGRTAESLASYTYEEIN